MEQALEIWEGALGEQNHGQRCGGCNPSASLLNLAQLPCLEMCYFVYVEQKKRQQNCLKVEFLGMLWDAAPLSESGSLFQDAMGLLLELLHPATDGPSFE